MKRVMRCHPSVVLLILVHLGTSACEPGLNCHDSCVQDRDCGFNQICADDPVRPRCVPAECRQCFEFDDRCLYELSEDDGANAVCTFTACN